MGGWRSPASAACVKLSTTYGSNRRFSWVSPPTRRSPSCSFRDGFFFPGTFRVAGFELSTIVPFLFICAGVCLFFAFRFKKIKVFDKDAYLWFLVSQHGAGRVLPLHGDPCGHRGRRVPFRDAGAGHGAAGRGNHGHPYRAGAHLRHAGNDAHADVRHCLGTCHGGAVAGYHAARPAVAVGHRLRATGFHRAAVLLREGQGVPRPEGAVPRIYERPASFPTASWPRPSRRVWRWVYRWAS